MRCNTITQDILQEFKIGRRYLGHDYILYGIYLMEMDKSSIGHITKSLYIDIADKYGTTSMCVERGIRTTIEMMWKNKNCNMPLLIGIFGNNYLTHRPSNTRFFELMYEYIEAKEREEDRENSPCGKCKYCRWSGQDKEIF